MCFFFLIGDRKEDIEDEVLKLSFALRSKNSEQEEIRTFQDKGLVFEKQKTKTKKKTPKPIGGKAS